MVKRILPPDITRKKILAMGKSVLDNTITLADVKKEKIKLIRAYRDKQIDKAVTSLFYSVSKSVSDMTANELVSFNRVYLGTLQDQYKIAQRHEDAVLAATTRRAAGTYKFKDNWE